MKHKTISVMISLAMVGVITSSHAVEETSNASLGNIVVEGEAEITTSVDTPYTSPTSVVTEEKAESINTATVEDFVKYEPSIVVRRRYIGDPNGVIGMRGSGMFQTSRTMVFADGVPLHNMLRSRWSGAPRWSMASPDETESVEIIYGPFSAEYAGNAMGGVVNINTKRPDDFEFNSEVGIFSQNFKLMGANDTYTGNKEFVSVGERFGKTSLYLSHNHLENDGQPMSFRYASPSIPVGGETAVNGAYYSLDSKGKPAMYYADTGTDKSITDLTKLKVGQEMGDWLARFTLAYEDHSRKNTPTNYLRDAGDTPVWSGAVVQDGYAFTVKGSNFALSDSIRENLMLATTFEGPVTSNWNMEVGVSKYDVLEDESISSKLNPDDPAYTGVGSLSEFDNTGWITLDVKLRSDKFMNNKNMNFITGVHFDHYSMTLNSYSTDYASGTKTSLNAMVGGENETQAVFSQWGLQVTPQTDITLGGRYERWMTMNGKNYNYGLATYIDVDTRTETGFSPKFSLGHKLNKNWKTRYSIAKAYRFPILEELYHNEQKTTGTTIANEKLKPEDGLHHNLMFEKQLVKGFMRFNLFQETIKNVIYYQTDTTATPTVTTYLPIDEVETQGAEFVVQQNRIAGGNTDVSFNMTWLDSVITKNSADTSIEGNVMARMPKWRANLLLTQHLSDNWNVSGGMRYSSDSYGNLDNSDTAQNVMGAIDGYAFFDVKTTYKIGKHSKIMAGIDNLTNETAFVAHPWPQRTFYLQGSLHF
ncbi:MAG: TonB-dependent receptor [Gammaproteobacteria bacterium]|nr:TonB-dependent receptor [Gammaproteobacteria bacterium]